MTTPQKPLYLVFESLCPLNPLQALSSFRSRSAQRLSTNLSYFEDIPTPANERRILIECPKQSD